MNEQTEGQMWEKSCELYERLKRLSPIFSSSAAPFLEQGAQALVVDMNDGTMVKAFKRWRDLGEPYEQLAHECASLMLFKGQAGRFAVPRIVDEPVKFDEDAGAQAGFVGYVRMTKIQGRNPDWDTIKDSASSMATLQRHAFDIGAAIASVHLAAEGHSLLDDVPLSFVPVGHHVHTVGINCPKRRARLIACNDYMMDNLRGGFCHADMKDGNIIVNNDDRIIGIVDFGLAGVHSNIYMDFVRLPWAFLPHAYKGYESVAGILPDAKMVYATFLSMAVNELPDAIAEGDEYSIAKITRDIDTALARFENAPSPK